MDSNEFTQNFWSLSEKNPAEVIVKSAESIVELLESKQKFSKNHEIKNRQKFRNYLHIFQNASEDLVYTLSRLIGGLSSISIELRKGYLLTLKLILEKFRNALNFNEIISAIEKETNMGKSETNYVRNCATSGRIIMLQTVLDVPSIPAENILKIIKSLCEILMSNKNMQETILFILKKFFEKLTNDYYHDYNFNAAKTSATAQKNFNKILQSIFQILEKYISNAKNQIEESKNIYEFSLYFLIAKLYMKAKNTKQANSTAKERIIMSLVESHFGTGFLSTIMDDGTILGFFKLIVKNSFMIENNQKNNSNKAYEKSLNISLDFFFETLRLYKEKEKVYKIWNLIIDENTNTILSEISPKNFQQLIYSVAKFILNNYFHMDYVKQIFDHEFFVSFLKFKIKQKFQYLNDIIAIVTEQIEKFKQAKHDNHELALKKISEYAIDLLKIFGSSPDKYLSIQTFKNFHAFLFNNLTEEDKLNYINKLSDVNGDSELEDLLEDENDYIFKITALKQLVEISDELKENILEFFFVEYMNNNNIEITNNLEEKLLQTVLNYCKEEADQDSEAASINKMRDVKICKKLKKVHSILHNTLKQNKIERINEEDIKLYKTYLKNFENLATGTEKKVKAKSKKIPEANGVHKNSIDYSKLDEKLISINKIALVLLIPFLKDPGFYSEILNATQEISDFGDSWQRGFCELNIEIFKLGNNALSDFCLNSFKKMSKYMDKTSFEFLLEFLNSEKQHIVKFDDMDVDEEESNSDEDEQQGEEGDDEDQ